MVVFITLILLTICSVSFPAPLSLRSTYKGLKDITPISHILAAGLNRMVYHHDQTVAIIDVNQSNEIQDCDIIEIYEPAEASDVLRSLSKTVCPMEVSFSQLTSLMYQCQTLDQMQKNQFTNSDKPKSTSVRVNIFGNGVSNLFSGILPGTKWCGTGDIAKNYHDLGTESEIDRCCRTHDLCPVKVRAQSSRYNLTNYSVYSKSHCDCDNAFYNCLKSTDSPAANIMGKIYFNIIKVGCIEDFPQISNIQKSLGLTRRFSATKLYY